MSIDKWFLISFTEWACKEAYHIVVTSDRPCHLFLRWSITIPRKHPRVRQFRGLLIHGDVYYCFTAFTEVEQDEAGDTLQHTFTVSPWPNLAKRYFYFRGEVNVTATPSQSPIFGRQIYYDEHSLTPVITADNDYVAQHFGTTYSMPGNPPVTHMVGRYVRPSEIEGGGFIFRPLALPFCADIQSASLVVTCSQGTPFVDVKSQISAEGTVTPDAWDGADVLEVLARWGTRIGVVGWDFAGEWGRNQVYFSPDISGTLRALTTLAGWSPEKAGSFFWEDFDRRTAFLPRYNREVYPRNVAPDKAAYMLVEYRHWQVKEVNIF